MLPCRRSSIKSSVRKTGPKNQYHVCEMWMQRDRYSEDSYHQMHSLKVMC